MSLSDFPLSFSLSFPVYLSSRLLSLSFILVTGMIATSFLALQDLGVAMVTVLKNLTNLFIIGGDFFLFGKVYNRYVWCTLALMIVSAICGSFTDLAFSPRGYSWQLINCAMTASYSLSLRLLMERYASSCATGGKKTLNEMSMVFYNNMLSIPLLVPLALCRGELAGNTFDGVSKNPRFVLAASLSVLCAFAISFSSLWFLSTTSATTYSLVGSINKVPLACIAVILSRVPVTLNNGFSISIGLVASIMFVWAKQRN